MGEEENLEAGQKGSASQPPSGKPGLKLKISKRIYVFDLKKKFAPVRRFALKKEPETPAENLMQKLSLLFKSKQQEQKSGEQKKEPPHGKGEPAKGQEGISSGLKIAGAAVGIFLLLIAFAVLAILTLPAPHEPPPSPTRFEGDFSISLIEAGVLSVGQIASPLYAGYATFEIDAKNISMANISASFFSEKPITQVFILRHPRESADTYPLFKASLSKLLSENKISLNEISTDELRALPEGALVIIPTGYFPAELLDSAPDRNFLSHLWRGVDIVYIGMPFDSLALDSSGTMVKINSTNISFAKQKLESKEGLLLYDPQYLAVPGRNSLGMQSIKNLYGSLSAIKYGKGVIIFIPQFLDSGWISDADSSGYEKAARDINKIILEELWTPKIAFGEAVLRKLNDKRKITLFSTPFQQNSAFVRIMARFKDRENQTRGTSFSFRVEKEQKGDIYPKDEASVPYYISGMKTRLNVAFKENDSTLVKLYIVLLNNSEEIQRSEFELGLTNPTIEKSVDFQVMAPPGRYLLSVVDASGKSYASTMLNVSDLDIAMTSANWQDRRFNFTLSSGGKPAAPPWISVSLNGKGEQSFQQADLSRSGGKITYSFFDKIEPGNHTFTFSMQGWKKDFYATYTVRKSFWDNPLFIFLGLVSALIFGIGFILRSPEKVQYGLDIPDFPPTTTIKIPVPRQTVLEIFDNVNTSYSWKWMPLRLEEIKGGFRKLTYNGKPIIVGDFNLELILSKLEAEGLVKQELGYWGKVSWEKESGHTIRYLMIYRMMRNIFVNNAVKFSKLDSVEECDVKAISGSRELYIHIMDGDADRVAHRALSTAKLGTTLIVFKAKEEAEDFLKALNSPSKLAVALKIGINKKSIFVLHAEALEGFVKEHLA